MKKKKEPPTLVLAEGLLAELREYFNQYQKGDISKKQIEALFVKTGHTSRVIRKAWEMLNLEHVKNILL